MIKNTKYLLILWLMPYLIMAQQENRFGLSFTNEQISGNSLCLDVELRFKNGGNLGSSNLVMNYNKTMLANPVFSSDNLPDDKYLVATVTNPVDSLASFNIELLNQNDGITIAQAPAKTVIGRLCFDVLAGMDATYLDWHIKNTAATVVFLDDETTQLKRGRIEVFCNSTGQSCDDGNPNTSADKYDMNCLCAGLQMNCVDETEVNQTAIPARTYKSRMKIRSEGTVRTNAKVEFKAGKSVTLGIGFHAEEGSDFLAKIEPCQDNLITTNVSNNKAEKIDPPILASTTTLLDQDLALAISPNPINKATSITYVLSKTEKVNVSIFSISGQLINTLVNSEQTAGMHLLEWQVNNLPEGMYFLQVYSASGQIYEKVVIQ